MVFGLGKGKIDLTLSKQNFMPGETITGNLILKLKKPILAKKLVVNLIGKKHVTQRMSGRRGVSTNRRSITIYEFELALGKEKEYLKEQHPFEIKIPANILQGKQKSEGAMGKAIEALKFLSGGNERIEWYVEAVLDIPKSLDVNKKVDITLG